MTALNLQEAASDKPAPVVAETSQEYLAFRLGTEEYGIDILKVQEIRGYDSVTAIANAPAYIKGVVNLRGIIVPIVDLRIAMKLADPTYDQFTIVIIVTIGQKVMGIVVDSVADVVMLLAEQIKPVPQMGAALNTDYLSGMGTLDERMLILIDIHTLMNDLLEGIKIDELTH